MNKKSDKNTISLRKLVITGWRRLLIQVIIASALIQVIVLSTLSLIGFAAFESGAGPARQWRFSSDMGDWIYRYPSEPIIIPLDKYAERRIVVGTRVAGKPYIKQIHGDTVQPTPLGGPTLFALNYIAPDGQQVFNFVEDRIGFPFEAARSVFIMESTSSPLIPAGVHWVVKHGIKIFGESGSSSLPSPREFVAIPLSPIYSGLLLNSIIYAIPVVIYLLLFRIFRIARACKRNHHGKCVACGYPVSETNRCPECGMDMQVEWKAALWAGCKLRHLNRLKR